MDASTIDQRLSESLARLDFVRCESCIYVRTLSDDVLGWVGCTILPCGETCQLHVNVGVLHLTIQALVAQASRHTFSRCAPPTALVPLYMLSSERRYTTWPACESQAAGSQKDGLVDCISTYGVPWMRRFGNVDALEQAARQQLDRDGARHPRNPIFVDPARHLLAALVLQGRRDEAKKVLHDRIAHLTASSQSSEAEFLRAFANELLDSN